MNHEILESKQHDDGHVNTALTRDAQQRLHSVVVGEIVSMGVILKSSAMKHVVLDCGTETIRTISQAPNLKVGLKTACAKPGTALNGGKYVEIMEYEGVESIGCVCSSFELGLGNKEDEIIEFPASFENGTIVSTLIEQIREPGC